MASAVGRILPVLLVSSVAAAAAAQTPARATDARTRQIYVSAVDSRGQPVTGLTAADFVVREDGVAREVVDARTATAPLHVVLLVDDSTATTDATVYIREGLQAFVERLHGKGSIELMTFGDRPTVVVPFTDDTEALKQQIARIFPRPGAGAYLLDAIRDATRSLARRKTERPAIVALTFERAVDYSNLQYQQVLEALRESGAALHVLAVGTPSASLSDEMRNRNIVIGEGPDTSGGRRDQVLAVSGIPETLKETADELAQQYVLTYQQPDRLVPPKKIEVSTPRRDVVVRARARLPER